MDLEPDIQPRAAAADKVYDRGANRQFARDRGAIPVAPFCQNSKVLPKHFGTALYRGRDRIERAVGKIRRFKRIALRCEMIKRNLSLLVAPAAALILVKSVHTT